MGLPAIYLVSPHAKLIAEGKKRLIVKSRKFDKYVGKEIFFLEDNEIYGTLIIEKVLGPYDVSQVRAPLRDIHQISDQEWQKWWSDEKEFWLYSFHVEDTYSPPVKYEVPKGVQTFIENIDVEFDIDKLDVSKLTKGALLHYHAKTHAWYNRTKEDKIRFTEKQIVDLHRRVVAEMKKRDLEHLPSGELDAKLEQYAAINPSGEIKGPLITLEQVINHYKHPIVLKRGYIKLVGGLTNWGKTFGDIDLFIGEQPFIVERDQPTMFRLGRALPPELAQRVQFNPDIYHGPFTNYLDLYDLVLVPVDRALVRMAEFRDETASAEAKKSSEEDKIEAGRFFMPLKGVKGYREEEAYSIDAVIERIGKNYPVAVQKKFDGAREVVMKNGDKVVIRSEDGVDVTSRYPSVAKEVAGLPVAQVSLDCEFEMWRGDTHFGREEVSGYQHGKSAADDSLVVASVHDCLFFNEEKISHHELKGTVGDLHKQPYGVRLRYLELLDLTQKTDKVPSPKKSHLNVVPTVTAKDESSLKKAIEEASGLPFSEGAMVKVLDSTYPLSGLTRAWVKFKKQAELHAIVLKELPTKTKGISRYEIGLVVPSGWKVSENKLREVSGKSYMYVGKTFTWKEHPKPGQIITVFFHTLFHHIDKESGEQYVHLYEPKPYEIRPDQTRPDSAAEAIDIAKAAKLYAEKFLSADLEVPEVVFDVMLTLEPDDEPHKYAMQHHYRGKSAHLDWRIQTSADELEGFTLFDLKKDAIKSDVTTVTQAKQLERNWNQFFKSTNEPGTYRADLRSKLLITTKEPEPISWLKVERVVKPGEVGGTKGEYGVFSLVDEGEVYFGALKSYFKEFFLYGKRFTGRWMIRKLPNPWRAERPRDEFVYLLWKPVDQLPYVLSSRSKRQDWAPPYGISALPLELRKQIPRNLQYWRLTSPAQRRSTLNTLTEQVKSGHLKLKLSTTSDQLSLGNISEASELQDPPELKSPEVAPFVLQHHWWSKEKKPVRVGPTTEHWDLRIELSPRRPLVQFVLDGNPIYLDSIDGIYKECVDHESMHREGWQEPGSPENPTKDTPAFLEKLDAGNVKIWEMNDMVVRLEFRGRKLGGMWVLHREEESMNLWTMKRTERGP